MDLNTESNRKILITVFPRLGNDANFEILSENTWTYNCIAWAMQYTDRWVSLERPYCWWPDGVERSMDCNALVKAFEAEGFEISDNSDVEDGYDKVALYKNANNGEWTHASRVIGKGVEHSKFGPSWDGKHSSGMLCETGVGYEASSYGDVFAFMKRKRGYKVSKKEGEGKMVENFDLLNKLIGNIT